jgi:hypothetical protein
MRVARAVDAINFSPGAAGSICRSNALVLAAFCSPTQAGQRRVNVAACEIQSRAHPVLDRVGNYDYSRLSCRVQHHRMGGDPTGHAATARSRMFRLARIAVNRIERRLKTGDRHQPQQRASTRLADEAGFARRAVAKFGGHNRAGHDLGSSRSLMARHCARGSSSNPTSRSCRAKQTQSVPAASDRPRHRVHRIFQGNGSCVASHASNAPLT